MIGKPDRKKDSFAARARARAVSDSMAKAPTRRATAKDMPPPPPPEMLAAMSRKGAPMSAPPDMAAPAGMAMKKGGAVKMKHGGKVPPKKGGLMIMIAMGKKKGK